MQCGRHIFSGAYVNNVKCIYVSALMTLSIELHSYEV